MECIDISSSCMTGMDFWLMSDRHPCAARNTASSDTGVLSFEDKASRDEGGRKCELSDIFRLHGAEYRARHNLSDQQKRVMFDIEHCRTSALGYHVEVCDTCGHREAAYNSCRNRHCPKCQGITRRRWVEKRLKDLLPVPYFHEVFTLPSEIFPVCLFNQEVVYNLLFESAAEALLLFGKDPKWLGGEIGFFGVLHTWGQSLCVHPHVHFVVAGGGIGENGEWIWLKYGGKFLFPVRALSKTFRRLFIEGLLRAYDEGRLRFAAELEALGEREGFDKWIVELESKEWVVFSRAPFAGPEDVVRYVGRYTHRVAISNARILSVGDEDVCFSYKDYRDGGERKEMSLSADEFIKRFLYHVLPAGFHKIRHYGFLGNGKKKKLQELREGLLPKEGLSCRMEEAAEVSDLVRCPSCGVGTLRPAFIVDRYGRVIIKSLQAMLGWNSS